MIIIVMQIRITSDYTIIQCAPINYNLVFIIPESKCVKRLFPWPLVGIENSIKEVYNLINA